MAVKGQHKKTGLSGKSVVCVMFLMFTFFWTSINNMFKQSITAQLSPTVIAGTEIETAVSKTNEDSSNSQSLPTEEEEIPYEYIPASTENYIMTHMKELEFDKAEVEVRGCKIYESAAITSQENYDNLQAFRQDLDKYTEAIKNFDGDTKDIMQKVRKCAGQNCDMAEMCKAVRLHPDGIQALFPSKELSWTQAGYVEPLLTPMRNPKYCDAPNGRPPLDIEYIVHDFEAMCLSLKPHSQIVFIDMGAALDFHGSSNQPAITLMKTFEKFGFNFDHIYAFEAKQTDPNKVYQQILPKQYFKAYHWINAGVNADRTNNMNPFYSIVSQFSEDDLIVVKLDIDTNEIENPLVKHLLEDDSVNKLVDHFYFEHHVHMYEIRNHWKYNWEGSIKDSFDLMTGLRKKGVAAHFWV